MQLIKCHDQGHNALAPLRLGPKHIDLELSTLPMSHHTPLQLFIILIELLSIIKKMDNMCLSFQTSFLYWLNSQISY